MSSPLGSTPLPPAVLHEALMRRIGLAVVLSVALMPAGAWAESDYAQEKKWSDEVVGLGSAGCSFRPGRVQLAADPKSHGGTGVNGPHRDALLSSSRRPRGYSLTGKPARPLSYRRFSIAC